METTQKWSSSWKASVQPRKQRLYNYNAPLNVRSKSIRAHLSKDLQKKYKMRNLRVIKDDIVKIMIGDFKNKQGKVVRVDTKKKLVFIEEAKRKRMDGSDVFVPLNASNLQLIELNLNNPRRFGKKTNVEQKTTQQNQKTEKNTDIEKQKTEKNTNIEKQTPTLTQSQTTTQLVQKPKDSIVQNQKETDGKLVQKPKDSIVQNQKKALKQDPKEEKQ
ncbi:MAG: 50S ribosomal protein L24 [Euryarchaeota archaeon HGW-Euryarchaeota-1]|nr:MAG: 50S ribosomal protein L24 [Euryarchaeota archaeon HGW-Euryarchaeota-1]